MVALVVNLKRWVTLLKLRSPALSWANATYYSEHLID
jgi:hypothetical protein